MRFPPATLLLLGFAGPRSEAEEIKRRLGQFLHDELALELSETKTLITHARTGAARFLGYEITVQHDDRKLSAGRRALNGGIRLRVPREVIATKCARYMQRGKPERRPELMNEQDHTIISHYGAEYRGIVQYFLSGDVYRLSRLRWVMVTSMLKTLAGKHDSTVTMMARKYAATIETPDGPRTCMQAVVDRGEGRTPLVATFGGIPLRRQKTAILRDRAPARPIGQTARKISHVRRPTLNCRYRNDSEHPDRTHLTSLPCGDPSGRASHHSGSRRSGLSGIPTSPDEDEEKVCRPGRDACELPGADRRSTLAPRSPRSAARAARAGLAG